MDTTMDTVRRAVLACTGAMAAVAMAVIGLMMLTICVDVVLRFALSAPTDWAYPLNAAGVLVSTSLAIPHLYATGHHISMDLLHRALSPPLRRAADLTVSAATAFLGIVVAITAGRSSLVALEGGLTGAGTFNIPLWIPDAVLCLTGVFLVLVAVLFPPGPTDDGVAAVPGDPGARADADGITEGVRA